MKGSANVLNDYDVLLRTGYLAHETSTYTNKDGPAAPPVEEVLSPDTAVENTDLLRGVDEAQSMELTDEEWELIHAVEKYQQSECVAAETIDKVGDKSEDEREAEYTALEARLKEKGMNEFSDGIRSELEVECDEYKSRISDIPDPKVLLERDEAEVIETHLEEACDEESMKNLPMLILGRESGYSSTPQQLKLFEKARC